MSANVCRCVNCEPFPRDWTRLERAAVVLGALALGMAAFAAGLMTAGA